MTHFQYMLRQDYDKRTQVGNSSIFCYSQKALDKLYPNGGYSVVGETLKKPKKTDKSKSEKSSESKNAPTGQLKVSEALTDVYAVGTYRGIAYKRIGYLAVSKDEYVALYDNRLPFLLLFWGLILLFLLLCLLIWYTIISPMLNEDAPHPLPPIDPGTVTPEGDNTEKVESEDGGGSVAMIYSLTATASLATGQIDIYFINPNASNHDVAVELYVLSGEEEHLIATSGLVPAGKGLTTMTYDTTKGLLQQGQYKALYRLACYDPKTGERALVMPEIADVTLTVKP